MSQAVLDVVAEDQQEEHVAEQVQPTAVQEHRGEDGERRRLVVVRRAHQAAGAMCAGPDLTGGHEPRHLMVDQLLWHRGVVVQERLQVAQLRQPAVARHRSGEAGGVEEHQHIGGDQRVRHIGRAAYRVHVMDGYDHKEVVPGIRRGYPHVPGGHARRHRRGACPGSRSCPRH